MAWVASVVVALSWCATARAATFSGCSAPELVLSPVPVSQGFINVPQVLNTVLWQGTVQINLYNCKVVNKNASFIIGGNIGTTTFVYDPNASANGFRSKLALRPGPKSSWDFQMVGCTFNAANIFFTSQSTQTFVDATTSSPNGTLCSKITFSYPASIFVAGLPTKPVAFPSSARPTEACGFYSLCHWAVFDNNGNQSFATSATSTAVFTPITCTLTPTNTTVMLDPAATTELTGAGQVAKEKAFTINLTGCSQVLNASNQPVNYLIKASWAFTADPFNASMVVNSASGPAANVGVQVLDANRVPVQNAASPDAATDPNATVVADFASAGGVLTSRAYYARYLAKGPAGPGNVAGVLQFTLTYQ